MKIIFVILTIGQIYNIYKMIKLNSWKNSPGLMENLYSENMLLRMIADQQLRSIQTEFFFRVLGLFFFYGTIWGLIDIYSDIKERKNHSKNES